MPLLVRPLTTEDLDKLKPIDSDYARDAGCEETVSAASLSFYGRSGHAFVLEEGGRVSGFLLAQAVWNGQRPIVTVRRAVAFHDAGRHSLLEAVTKSAYDAGAYDILVEHPEGDTAAERALFACGYAPLPTRLYSRVLGSRARADS
ncbi:MAG: DUF1999 family protein [Trueperaceae bacterium]